MPKNKNSNKYSIPSTPEKAIVVPILIENLNFDELDLLTKQIETKTIEFIEDIVAELS